MNNKLPAVIGGIAFGFAMAISAPVFAENDDFNVWDKDNSGVVTVGEWDTGFDSKGLLGRWDGDKDGVLSDEEFGQGVFNSYDADKSGDWNEDEYNAFRDDAGDGGWLDV